LYQKLSSGIQTNLTLKQAIELAWLATGIRSESIHTAAIGSKDMISDVSEAGQTVFRPNQERIRLLVADLFGLSNAAAVPIPSLLERMQSEEASLAIIDASRVEGLADRTASKLKSQGILVTGISRADKQAARTHLIDYTGRSIPSASWRNFWAYTRRDRVPIYFRQRGGRCRHLRLRMGME
jgi:hypothetical protein